jgi:hypothetical protein
VAGAINDLDQSIHIMKNPHLKYEKQALPIIEDALTKLGG